MRINKMPRTFKKQSTLTAIKRLNNSRFGKPQYLLTFANGLSGKTKANSGEAYAISDHMIGQSITFDYYLTNSGREYIENIKPTTTKAED